MAKKQKSKSKSKSRKSAASKADKHLLYEQAVQETEADILLAENIFKALAKMQDILKLAVDAPAKSARA